jgi:hypothetical protein
LALYLDQEDKAIKFHEMLRRTPLDVWIKSLIWMLMDGRNTDKIILSIHSNGTNLHPIVNNVSFDNWEFEMKKPNYIRGININMCPLSYMVPVLSPLTCESGVQIQLASKKLLRPDHLLRLLELMPKVDKMEVRIHSKLLEWNVITNCNSRLTHLSVICRDFMGTHLLTNNKWSHLTSLDISESLNAQGSMMLECLNQLPNLRKLTIHPVSILDVRFSSADQFPFGNLKELEIFYTDSRESWQPPIVDVWRKTKLSRHLSNLLESYTGPVPTNLDIISTAFPNLQHLAVTRVESFGEDNLVFATSNNNNFTNLMTLSLRNVLPLDDCECYYLLWSTKHRKECPFGFHTHKPFKFFEWTSKQQLNDNDEIDVIVKLLNEYATKEVAWQRATMLAYLDFWKWPIRRRHTNNV